MLKKTDQALSGMHSSLLELILYGMKLTSVFLASALTILVATYFLDFSAQFALYNYVKDFVTIGAVILVEILVGVAFLNEKINK